MGAAGAVAYGVIPIAFLGQAFALQSAVGAGLGQAVQLVVGVADFAQIGFDLGDVACRVVLVGTTGQDLISLVLDFDAGELGRDAFRAAGSPSGSCSGVRRHDSG